MDDKANGGKSLTGFEPVLDLIWEAEEVDLIAPFIVVECGAPIELHCGGTGNTTSLCSAPRINGLSVCV